MEGPTINPNWDSITQEAAVLLWQLREQGRDIRIAYSRDRRLVTIFEHASDSSPDVPPLGLQISRPLSRRTEYLPWLNSLLRLQR